MTIIGNGLFGYEPETWRAKRNLGYTDIDQLPELEKLTNSRNDEFSIKKWVSEDYATMTQQTKRQQCLNVHCSAVCYVTYRKNSVSIWRLLSNSWAITVRGWRQKSAIRKRNYRKWNRKNTNTYTKTNRTGLQHLTTISIQQPTNKKIVKNKKLDALDRTNMLLVCCKYFSVSVSKYKRFAMYAVTAMNEGHTFSTD